jgi:chromosome segregation ATPase
LTKSFGDVQAELATNAKIYNDCIESYEKEADVKDERIRGLEEELRMANEQIQQLESQIVELTSELEKERIVSANLTSVVSELQSELTVARTNANGYDDIISILRRESEKYQSELANARNDTQLYKEKTSDLEELLSKTKDSLVSEKKRVVDALTAKDNQIAQLDRDLADKCNEVRASEAAIEATTKELSQMTNKYNTEKDRADALDRKIEQLNQLTAANAVAATETATSTTGSSEEVDRLTKLMEEISKSNDEYKSLVSIYDDKVKFLSRQLLLSGQNLSNKQSQIECLRRDLVAAISEARLASKNKSSASEEVTTLRAKLEDVQSKSTMWKAQANGMIIQLTNDLREKDASMLELQNKLEKFSEGKPENGQQQEQQSSTINGGTQDEAIAQLRYAMEEAQLKAKERIKQKNQSLKEMEDMVTTLTSEMEDLRREKDKLNDRLVEENERSKHDYEIHERQLRQIEDRLSKEHLAAMTEIENEMNQTVRQLEMEIETLKRNSAMGATASSQGTATVKSAHNDLKVQEMEEALRRSKDMEVSLINQNMQMKYKIQDLQQLVEERSNVAGMLLDDDEDDGSDEMSDKPLPTYYRERQRPQVIQFVGNAWKRLFRRKQLM